MVANQIDTASRKMANAETFQSQKQQSVITAEVLQANMESELHQLQ